MELSQQFKTSHHAVVSPGGAYTAILTSSRLQIRSTASSEIIRSIPVFVEASTRNVMLRWPTVAEGSHAERLLLADEDNVRVWDLRDEKWSAAINNGSGGMGKIVNAEFGRTESEVVLFSDFGAKVTVWSLASGRSVEIRDPKFSTKKGFGYRPHTGLFALLSRPGPQDVVTLHAPSTYYVLKTITLPSADAQGLKWSADGRWFVVWDAPSVGYKIYIYTADGHLYRIYNGGQEGDMEGLGIKSVEWSPHGDYLAIGGFDRRVTLLSTRTFSPVVFLDHTPSIQLASGDVWEEQVSAAAARSYNVTAQPISPPLVVSAPSDPVPKAGISLIVFNAEGTHVATRDDSSPTAVWIWDLTQLSPRTVLLQHAPVKHLLWHPSKPEFLLIQCTHDEPVLYIWDATQDAPAVLPIPLHKGSGRLEARWLSTPRDKKPGILLADAQGAVIAWPDGKEAILRFERPSTPGKADESDDSLFDILTGRTPLPPLAESTVLVADETLEDSGSLEDTFRGRRHTAMTSVSDEFF